MAGCNGNGLCFHGAFGKRAKAEAKKRSVGKEAFLIKKFIKRGDYRYIVATRDTAADFDFGFGKGRA